MSVHKPARFRGLAPCSPCGLRHRHPADPPRVAVLDEVGCLKTRTTLMDGRRHSTGTALAGSGRVGKLESRQVIVLEPRDAKRTRVRGLTAPPARDVARATGAAGQSRDMRGRRARPSPRDRGRGVRRRCAGPLCGTAAHGYRDAPVFVRAGGFFCTPASRVGRGNPPAGPCGRRRWEGCHDRRGHAAQPSRGLRQPLEEALSARFSQGRDPCPHFGHWVSTFQS